MSGLLFVYKIYKTVLTHIQSIFPKIYSLNFMAISIKKNGRIYLKTFSIGHFSGNFLSDFEKLETFMIGNSAAFRKIGLFGMLSCITYQSGRNCIYHTECE